MPLHPPSTLYDRIEAAHLLSDVEQAQLTALAEELWSEMGPRTQRAERAGLERAFWSLIAEWEGLPAVAEDAPLAGQFGLERVREIEDRLGETLIGSLPSSPPSIDLNSVHPDEEVLFDFPKRMARFFGVFPVRKQERLIELASSSPKDAKLWLNLSMATGMRVRLLFSPAREIERAIKRFYPDARDPIPHEPLRLLLSVRNQESLAEDGFDLEFAEQEEIRSLVGDLVGRLLSEGIDCVMLEPTEDALQLNIFTDSWRPLAAWPRNLWRPIDLALRRLSDTPAVPWEQEGFLDWPFMGTEYRLWLMWTEIEETPTLTIQPFVPELD